MFTREIIVKERDECVMRIGRERDVWCIKLIIIHTSHDAEKKTKKDPHGAFKCKV